MSRSTTGTTGAVLAALLGRHFWITAYAMLLAGLFLPGDYHRLRPSVPFLLGGILYCTCLKISLGEIRRALTPEVLVRVGMLVPLRLVAVPLLMWGLALLIDHRWAPGVALVAASPAGMSSVAFADLYGGSRMFALLMTLSTSLLCPLSMPVLLRTIGAPAAGATPLIAQMLYVLAVLAAPFAAAQLTRSMLPGVVERHYHRWGYGAVLSSCCLIFVSIAANRQAWAGWPMTSLLEPLALGCLISVVSAGVGVAMRWVIPPKEAIAYTCGEIWINNGLAVAFATQFFAGQPYMVLPAILLQVPIIAAMTTFGWWTMRQGRAVPEIVPS